MVGRTALVTGGGSGLGRATCLELAAAGAHVVVADIDEAGADLTLQQVREHGGSGQLVLLDVSDPAAVDGAFAELFEQFGAGFDALVNNAGTDRGADVTDVRNEQWHAVFAVNTHGPMYTSRAFLRGVLAAGVRARPADIVSVISISALTVGAGAAAYNSSKAALLKLTEILQTEARERGWPVRVCALSPSAMDTPMMAQWSLPAEKMMHPRTVARLIAVALTMPDDAMLQSAVVTSRVEQYPR